MYFKKLIGEKVYLSPIEKDDFLKYTDWINDMEVCLGLPMSSKLINIDTQKSILDKLSNKDFNFAIIDAKKDTLIGNIGFPKLDYINHSVTIGIFIGDKNYWGNGYGSDALNLILDFAFNILNMNSANLTVYSFNLPAIACYKKVGFKEAGRLREAKIIGGQKFDEIFMDILASEFISPYVNSLLNERLKIK